VVTAEKAISDFLSQPQGNLWVSCGRLKIYLRKSPLLTVANVTKLPKYQGNGEFTRFLDYIEGRFSCIYIEQVLNERLVGFLLRRGYVEYIPMNFRFCTERTV
jgi:hypothetical protein